MVHLVLLHLVLLHLVLLHLVLLYLDLLHLVLMVMHMVLSHRVLVVVLDLEVTKHVIVFLIGDNVILKAASLVMKFYQNLRLEYALRIVTGHVFTKMHVVAPLHMVIRICFVDNGIILKHVHTAIGVSLSTLVHPTLITIVVVVAQSVHVLTNFFIKQ
jgi:hypothetical protein